MSLRAWPWVVLAALAMLASSQVSASATPSPLSAATTKDIPCACPGLLPFSVGTFNSLPPYETARPTADATSSRIDPLGSIMRSSRLANDVGVSLLHKHFDLHDGELLLERVVGDVSVSRPVPVDTLGHARVLPHTFALTASGGLVPLEYVMVTSETDHMAARLCALCASTDARAALAESLDLLGLRDVYGVSVKHRDAVAAADPRHATIESSSEDERWLYVRPVVSMSKEERDFFSSEDNAGLSGDTLWVFGGSDYEAAPSGRSSALTPTPTPSDVHDDEQRPRASSGSEQGRSPPADDTRSPKQGNLRAGRPVTTCQLHICASHWCGVHRGEAKPTSSPPQHAKGVTWCGHACGSHKKNSEVGRPSDGLLDAALPHAGTNQFNDDVKPQHAKGVTWCGHACGNHKKNSEVGRPSDGLLDAALPHASTNQFNDDAKPQHAKGVTWCGHGCEHACGNHKNNNKLGRPSDDLLDAALPHASTNQFNDDVKPQHAKGVTYCGHGCEHVCGIHKLGRPSDDLLDAALPHAGTNQFNDDVKPHHAKGVTWCGHACGSHKKNSEFNDDVKPQQAKGVTWCGHACGSHKKNSEVGRPSDDLLDAALPHASTNQFNDDVKPQQAKGVTWCGHACGSHKKNSEVGRPSDGLLDAALPHASTNQFNDDAKPQHAKGVTWCGHGCEHACGNHKNNNKLARPSDDLLDVLNMQEQGIQQAQE